MICIQTSDGQQYYALQKLCIVSKILEEQTLLGSLLRNRYETVFSFLDSEDTLQT